MSSIEDRLESVKKMRQTEAFCLSRALGVLAKRKRIFEVDLELAWLERLGSAGLDVEGWYDPPPKSIAVMFATLANPARTNYATLRPQSNWPQDDISLDRESGLAYLFHAPVDRETGMIGDFGLNVYLGDDRYIHDRLQECLAINKKIADFVEIGMQLREIYNFAENLFAQLNLQNLITSTTDTTGVDIGHTIPHLHDGWSETDFAVIARGGAERNALISGARHFVNREERYTIQAGDAITIEPRLVEIDREPVMLSYHTILLIHPDGTKVLSTEFDDILKTTARF